MPTYHSPSSSPSSSPSRSLSRSPPRHHRNRSPSPSRSRSSSRSLSRSRSRSSSPDRPKRLRDRFPSDGVSDSKAESIVKTSLVFLGAVGAATLAAHKFWPKGITYGEKEEWECERKKEARRAGRGRDGERGGREGEKGGDRGKRGGDGGRARDDGERGRDRGGRGEGRGGRYAAAAGAGAAAGYAGSNASFGSGGGRSERGRGTRDERDGGRARGRSAVAPSYVRDEVVERDRSGGVDVGRSRSRLRERSVGGRATEYRIVDRAASPAFVVERRTITREVDSYPPSPPRPVGERGGGPTRHRARSVGYGDEPEGVYVRRQPVAAARHYAGGGSVADVRPRSRYDDDYYR